MFLTTGVYDGGNFRISTADLATHIQWTGTVGAKMPAGSNYTIEIGHNGNGNIEVSERVVLNSKSTTHLHSLRSPTKTRSQLANKAW